MELTIALNRYDRFVPFFNDTVRPPDGVTLKPLEVGESTPFRDGGERHTRLFEGEWDIGEMGLAPFIIAVANDPNLPLVGIPSFPRRFFSPGQIYINPDAGIEKPEDLSGKKIGVHMFQTTLSVLAKGDLKADHGVNWQDCEWYSMNPEVRPIDIGDDVVFQRIGKDKDIGIMLMEGEIDALISPQPRQSMLDNPDGYRRLHPDPISEDVAYFKRHGYYPIMHLMVIRRALADAYPELPREIMRMCQEAQELAYSYYDDSNYSLLAWSRNALEEQRQRLGADPWTSGLAANRQNLEDFIGYAHDQRLIDAPYAAANLFHASLHDT
jgi:4,5-dihydroxyphthalate decarboxylase